MHAIAFHNLQKRAGKQYKFLLKMVFTCFTKFKTNSNSTMVRYFKFLNLNINHEVNVFFLLEILRNYTLDFKYMKMIVLNKSNILYFSFPWSSEWTGSGSAVQEKFRIFLWLF